MGGLMGILESIKTMSSECFVDFSCPLARSLTFGEAHVMSLRVVCAVWFCLSLVALSCAALIHSIAMRPYRWATNLMFLFTPLRRRPRKSLWRLGIFS